MSISDKITIASIVVTIGSIVWAAYERRQAVTAKQQVRHFRRLLLKQQIAQQFANVPGQALALTMHIRHRKWQKAAEVALSIAARVAGLNGLNAELVDPKLGPRIQLALAELTDVLRHLPLDSVPSSSELESKLLQSSTVVLSNVTAIESFLYMQASLGGDKDAD